MVGQLVNVSVALLVLYNVLQAFKASREDRKLHKRYNKYFMVIAVFLVLDNLLSFILDFVPFYQLFKLMVVAWMSIPACTGAVFVYKFYIHGVMARYEGDLEEMVERIRSMVSGYFNEYYEKAQRKYRDSRSSVAGEGLVGMRAVEEARKASPADLNMEEASDSGFSTIDSTAINEEKHSPGLDSRWSNKPSNDVEG